MFVELGLYQRPLLTAQPVVPDVAEFVQHHVLMARAAPEVRLQAQSVEREPHLFAIEHAGEGAFAGLGELRVKEAQVRNI